MAAVGHDGLNAMLVGFDTKEATAICTFAYSAGPGMYLEVVNHNMYDSVGYFAGTEPILFEGHTEGTIVPARGPKVFGWDAVFEPLGTGMTLVFFLF